MIYLKNIIILISICIRTILTRKEHGYTNEWVIKLQNVDDQTIGDTAMMCNLECIGKVRTFLASSDLFRILISSYI